MIEHLKKKVKQRRRCLNLNTDVAAAQRSCKKKACTKTNKQTNSLAEYAVDNRKHFLLGSKQEENQVSLL